MICASPSPLGKFLINQIIPCIWINNHLGAVQGLCCRLVFQNISARWREDVKDTVFQITEEIKQIDVINVLTQHLTCELRIMFYRIWRWLEALWTISICFWSSSSGRSFDKKRLKNLSSSPARLNRKLMIVNCSKRGVTQQRTTRDNQNICRPTFEASSKFDAEFSSLVIKYKWNLGDQGTSSEPIWITVFSSLVTNVRFSSKLSLIEFKVDWILLKNRRFKSSTYQVLDPVCL